MGKEIVAGSQHYKRKGLRMIAVYITDAVKVKYARKAKRKGWSLVRLVSSVLMKNAPK